MTDRRVMLDWATPLLPAAADWLIDRDGFDLGACVVVVPGGRAGRRLVELLVERAEASGAVLIPPRTVTVGRLIDELADYPAPVADAVASHLAWVEALRSIDREAMTALIPDPPSHDDSLGWAAIAEHVDALHSELAGESLAFADVACRGAELPDFNDEPRWTLLADVAERYVDRLAHRGLVDPHLARRDALDAHRLRDDRRVVLVGLAELNRTQRQAVDQLADAVTILVHAPASLRDAFDDHGCVQCDHWGDARIDFDDERWRIVDAPADQADAVVHAIDELGGSLPADRITLGLCDESVLPHLEQVMPAHGISVRYAAGVRVGRTRPLRLLAAVADWLDGRRFSAFASLLRHVDVEAAIHRAVDTGEGAIEDWLTLLDTYYNDHLAGRITGEWLGDAPQRDRLKAVHDAVVALAGDLSRTSPRPLDQWAQPIADLLVRVYGEGDRTLDRRDEADRVVIEACDRLAAQLRLIAALRDAPTASAAEAMRLLVRFTERADDAVIPPEADAACVEVLGPLELHHDDADACIITGVNEGRLPASIVADPFLPDHLRSVLGLLDNARRYARDAYALSAVFASRPHVTLITARRDVEGTPLTPSRLLFAADTLTAARRVRRFVDAGESAVAPLPPGLVPAGSSRFVLPVEPRVQGMPPIVSLSVTAFRAYLACPYRFYLAHVLRLRRIDDAAQELDPLGFGSLAHEVLAAFGESDVAASTSERSIRAFLDDALDRRVRSMLGSTPPPAVRVQVELLRLRLAAFARVQAEHAVLGWRIAHTERGFKKGEASLLVDGLPMGLTGRIDRIDIHASTGELAVFDYKTSDRGEEPSRTHVRSGEWVDLQLPLYRHLVRSMKLATDAGVRLGYICLPRDVRHAGVAWADWDELTLEEADATAEHVVRQVRANVYWPPAASVTFDDFADLCGVGQLAAALRSESAGEAGA